MRPDDVCLIVALKDLKMLSWFDLLLVFTNYTHVHRDSYWHKAESLEHGCRRTAAAVLL